MTRLNKNHFFSAVLIIITAAIANQFIPVYVKPVLKLTLSQNQVGISDINQPRKISETKIVWVDKLNLYQNNSLTHPKLGAIGWGERFFIDMRTEFDVKKTANYLFIAGSDDGFKLTVNGKVICHYDNDRGFSKQTCRAKLIEGKNNLELNYFQGYGLSGLVLEYKKVGEKKTRYWGEDSQELSILHQ